MGTNYKVYLKCALRLFAILQIALVLAAPVFSQTSPPVIVSTVGYLNGTALTTHTSNAFNSSGASTLVAFVSSLPSWNGVPVSFSGVTDNRGNTWTLLTGPTLFSGSTFPLMSARGSHTFSVKAQDAVGNQSAATGFTWTIDTTAPPMPTLTSTPANPTNQTSASLSFTDTQAGVSFLCQLDGSAFGACSSPKAYSGLSQGTTFSVKAQDAAGNQSAATSLTWTIDTIAPPKPTLTSTPTNSTTQTSASFSFTDTQAGVSFLCQLDSRAFTGCSSPVSYAGLTRGKHKFSVKAQDAAGNVSGPASFS